MQYSINPFLKVSESKTQKGSYAQTKGKKITNGNAVRTGFPPNPTHSRIKSKQFLFSIVMVGRRIVN